jgi:hypothetical protein
LTSTFDQKLKVLPFPECSFLYPQENRPSEDELECSDEIESARWWPILLFNHTALSKSSTLCRSSISYSKSLHYSDESLDNKNDELEISHSGLSGSFSVSQNTIDRLRIIEEEARSLREKEEKRKRDFERRKLEKQKIEQNILKTKNLDGKFPDQCFVLKILLLVHWNLSRQTSCLSPHVVFCWQLEQWRTQCL